jgi:hypothetical protein
VTVSSTPQSSHYDRDFGRTHALRQLFTEELAYGIVKSRQCQSQDAEGNICIRISV